MDKICVPTMIDKNNAAISKVRLHLDNMTAGIKSNFNKTHECGEQVTRLQEVIDEIKSQRPPSLSAGHKE